MENGDAVFLRDEHQAERVRAEVERISGNMGSKGGREDREGGNGLGTGCRESHLYLRYGPWLIVVAIILITAGMRIRVLNVPLERDEGEYAYAGQLILDGVPPYDQAYNMKMPGIYAAYAVIMGIFGQSCAGIHLGLLIVNAATIVSVFLLTRYLAGSLAGVFAAALFAVLSFAPSVLGTFAHAEHFVLLFAVPGILLLLIAVERRNPILLLIGAVLLGIGFMMKQHGMGFLLFAGFYLLVTEMRRRPVQIGSLLLYEVVLVGGVLLPFGATCGILYHAGVFERFWFWTVTYAREYVSMMPLKTGLEVLGSQIKDVIEPAILIWGLAGVGLIVVFASRKLRPRSTGVVGFLLFSFLGTCPGFYFREHYFILMLPAIALLAGIALAGVERASMRLKGGVVGSLIAALLGLAVLSHAVYQQKAFLSATDLNVLSRDMYGPNPFPESLKIAEYVKAHTCETDTIAILGSEPQICFYAHRRSATGYIYAYPLMESHPYAGVMQQEMIQQIEAAEPKFLIFVDVSASWLAEPTSNNRIIEWFQKYQDRYYKMVGAVDIVDRTNTLYKWDEKGFDYTPRSSCWIAVLERKNGAQTSAQPEPD